MFPQSELDNYKLQVELLQEKLQRSEISRQQLEHKLDKILQKRDEHDKMVRSKAKQKYQQFLEEQQRRNERNKQLVQMLERIEQQTEAMNARSERLKMMKLQYEMYFAKLVHSQTRRCIQNSVVPVTQIMPTQTIQSNMSQPTMEGYNYVTNIEAHNPIFSNPYQTCATTSNFENQSISRLHPQNIPNNTTEIPTLTNFFGTEGHDRGNFRNINIDPSTQQQQFAQYQSNYEPNNNIAIPENNAVNNTNMSLSSLSNLLPSDKQLTAVEDNSNISTTTSSTFEKIPNAVMMSQNMHSPKELPDTTTTITKTYNDVNSNETLNNNENTQPLQNMQYVNGTALKYMNQMNKNSIKNPQKINGTHNVENEIRNVTDTRHELQANAITMPILNKKSLASSDLNATKAGIATLPNSSNNINYVNRKPKTTDQIANETLANKDEINTSITSVSIENIENEIYGERLSPLETEDIVRQEGPNSVPKLLENLVTQAENIHIENNSEEPISNRPDKSSDEDNIATAFNSDQNQVTQNYEQTAAYSDYNNAQQSDDLASGFPNYTNYENMDNTAIDETQQQYDYSNYDPTQYSYPGYIYDETTGEYKPDPNAPTEQYGTDQQYTTDGYDQQYQQQDYDYNQTYAEVQSTSSTAVESPAYNNYETAQPDISDTNVEQPQTTNQEPVALQSDLAAETPISSTKATKPTSILSTADKNDSQKKKKRVNFVDSSETDESAAAEKKTLPTTKSAAENLAGSSESDFDFSSSTEAEAKAT